RFVASPEHDGGAGIRERLGGRGSDSLAGPRYQGNPALHRLIIHRLPLSLGPARVVVAHGGAPTSQVVGVPGQGRPGTGGAPGVPAMKLMWAPASRGEPEASATTSVTRRSPGTSWPRYAP